MKKSLMKLYQLIQTGLNIKNFPNRIVTVDIQIEEYLKLKEMAQRELREPSAQISWMIKIFYKYYKQTQRLNNEYEEQQGENKL